MNHRVLLASAVAAILVVGAAIIYLQLRPTPAAVANQPDNAATRLSTPIPVAETPQPKIGKALPMPRATPAPAAAITPPPPLPEYELKLDQILKAGYGQKETAQMLINMLPTLPPEGQTEAAQHISNLTSDEEYSQVRPLLSNPTLPSEVQDVLVTDLLNRSDTVKLPALLDIAKMPNHPFHDEAVTDLQIFLNGDQGQDWAKWDSAIKQYLRNQATLNGL